MANREGKKTVAVEIPIELYDKLEWAIGKQPAGLPNTNTKRMSDVLRFVIAKGFDHQFGGQHHEETRKAAAVAKRAEKKADTSVNA